jgi:hypothetical protein
MLRPSEAATIWSDPMFQPGHACACQWTSDCAQLVVATNRDAVGVWDANTGAQVALFPWPRAGQLLRRAFSESPDEFAFRDDRHTVALRLEGVDAGGPVVTAVRLWCFGTDVAESQWDDKVTTLCPGCGTRSVLSQEILAAISQRGTMCEQDVAAGAVSARSPWAERRWDAKIVWECPRCHRLLRFNAFIVDDSQVRS